MKALIAAIFMFVPASLVHASTLYTMADCEPYFLKINDLATEMYLEYDGQLYGVTDMPVESGDDLLDINVYSARLPVGEVEITTSIRWYDHRDRVASITDEGVLKSATGTVALTCK